MSVDKPLCAATLNQCGDLVENRECVRFRALPPFTTLLVRTVNSLYRVVISQEPDVYVQGGAFLPEATSAYVGGVSIGGGRLKADGICVGQLIAILAGGRRIITSQVLAITVLATGSAVH